MNRPLGALLLLAALTGCGTPAPTPAPKFEETDPCTLLKSGDVEGRPLMTTVKDAPACHFQFGTEKTAMRVTLRLHARTFDEAKKLFGDRGYGAVIGDRPMVRDCGGESAAVVTCSAIVDAGERKNFEMTVAAEKIDVNVLGQITQGLAAKVLERLPK